MKQAIKHIYSLQNTIVCFLACFFFNISVSYAETIVLNRSDKIVEVFEYAEVYIDSSAKIASSTIYRGKLDGRFKKPPNSTQYSVINANYWVKIDCQTNEYSNFKLEAYSSTLDTIDVFVVWQDSLLMTFSSGSKVHFNNKIIGHKNFVFPLPNFSNKPIKVYVRSKSNHYDGLKMVLKSDGYFVSYALSEYLLLGLFYGILLLVILQNLFLYFKSKSYINVYYIAFVVFFGLYTLSNNGLGYQYLWPAFPGLNKYAVDISLFALEVFMLLYLFLMLEFKSKYPKTYKLLQNLITARSIVFVLSILNVLQTKYIWVVDVLVFLAAFLAILPTFKLYKGHRKYILYGFIALFCGFLVEALRRIGYIQLTGIIPSLLVVYIFNISSIFEILFFSYAITARIKELDMEVERSQKEIIQHLQEKEEISQRVNKELETKVRQRTEELNEANEKLQVLMDQVNEMNLSLDLDNRSLKKEAKEISHKKILMKEVSFEDFIVAFPDKTACLKFLSKHKWPSESSYKCKKCGNKKYNNGVSFLSKRCTSCNYEESCSSNTLYERLRIDLPKAFYMTYLIYRSKGKITIDDLQDRTDLNRTATWRFRKRVVDRYKERLKNGEVSDLKGWDQLIV